MKACDKNIQSTIKLSEQMIELAQKGYSDCLDTGCLVLYGVLLDSAYKMKKIAEKEKQVHVNKGGKMPGKQKMVSQ